MFYICVRAHNDAQTVGLLLWKVRQVFSDNPREYRLLVADDGSSDDTAEVLDRYGGALPLKVFRNDTPRGYAAAMETLLRACLERSDRPRRDCAITIPADYTVSPGVLPELIRRFESGADLVIAEAPGSEATLGGRMVRRFATALLRPGLELPGIHDVLSGVCAIRLVTLKRAVRGNEATLLQTDGEVAAAELVGRMASEARQIAAVEVMGKGVRAVPGTRPSSITRLVSLYRAGRLLHLPVPDTTVQRVL